MRISIGITSYNQHQYVEKTIISLLNQTVLPDELVISDNYSTDGSFEIIKKYEGKIKIIRPSVHKPYYEHINFLIENLTGDYVLLAASDDIYLPNFVEECKKKMDNRSAIIRFGYNLIDSEDNLIKRIPLRFRKKTLKAPSNFLESLCYNNVPMWSSIFRRTALLNAGGFGSEIIHFDHDWATALKLSTFGDYVTVPNVVVCNYRYQYRSDAERIRLEGEAKDTALICSVIAQKLFSLYNLNPRLLRSATIFNLKKKIELYKKYNCDYSMLFEMFGITKEDVENYSKWDYYYLLFRTKVSKIL